MSYLVIGGGAFGHAEDLATAKKNFTRFGGALSRGYTIAEFGENLTFKGVDGLGRCHWDGTGEPTITEVAAKGARR